MQKERPILYSTPMAQAKLAGRKTQTRRIVKNHPGNKYPNDDCWYETRCSYQTYVSEEYEEKGGEDKILGPEWLILDEDGDVDGFLGNCPYGQPGDLLWGRESWNELYNLKGTSQLFTRSDLTKDPHNWQRYLDNEFQKRYVYAADNNGEMEPPTWKPSIHMPKEAARIWDEITGIRVERVADISKADCIAEGIEPVGELGVHKWYKDYLSKEGGYTSPRNSIRSLWQSINGTPRPIQSRQNGKLIITGYEVYPFDEQAAAEFNGLSTWRGKPLTVITNPWVWVIETKQLSVTGRPVNT